MSFFDTRYFRINKLFLSLNGLWPYETPYKKLLSQLFSLFSVAYAFVPQVIFLLKHTDNMDEMVEVMPTLTGTVLCFAKMYSLIKNSKMFKELLQHTQDDWNNLLTKEETQILLRYAEKNRIITLVYSIALNGLLMCYAMLPLTAPILDIISPLNETRPKKMPHPADFVIFDPKKHYYKFLFFNFIGYSACGAIAVAADTLYIFLVEHTCGMYSILCYRLKNLPVHDKLQWVDTDYMHKEITQHVRLCIQLHERIKLYIETMEYTLAEFLFCDVGFGCLLNTCSCIMIVYRMGSSEIMRHAALTLMQSFRLFFSSWAGQQVTDHSSEVSIAAYNGKWYNASTKVQKLLLFLIMRSQKVCQITIAKLYVINLEGFSKIMKTSVSYCTVMISIREP